MFDVDPFIKFDPSNENDEIHEMTLPAMTSLTRKEAITFPNVFGSYTQEIK